MSKQEISKKRFRQLTYGSIIYMIVLILFCQWMVFEKKEEIGLSILIGTCGTLVGCFSALLASPFGTSEKERFSKLGTIISTLITGYVLAKIIDPVISFFTGEGLSLILSPKNGANVLIALIGFLSGFLLAYQYRVYISREFLDGEQPEKKETSGDLKSGITQIKSESADGVSLPVSVSE